MSCGWETLRVAGEWIGPIPRYCRDLGIRAATTLNALGAPRTNTDPAGSMQRYVLGAAQAASASWIKLEALLCPSLEHKGARWPCERGLL